MRKKQKIINLYKNYSINSIKNVISVGSEEDLNQFWDFLSSLEDLDQEHIVSVIDILFKIVLVEVKTKKDFFKDISIKQDVIDEMNELENEMENLLYTKVLTDIHKNKLISFFTLYSKILNNLVEFKELSYAITMLSKNIDTYNIADEMLNILMLNTIKDLIE